MKISIDMISDMANSRSSSSLEQLILDYGKLKQQISRLENHNKSDEPLSRQLKYIEDQFNLNYYFPINFWKINIGQRY